MRAFQSFSERTALQAKAAKAANDDVWEFVPNEVWPAGCDCARRALSPNRAARRFVFERKRARVSAPQFLNNLIIIAFVLEVGLPLLEPTLRASAATTARGLAPAAAHLRATPERNAPRAPRALARLRALTPPPRPVRSQLVWVAKLLFAKPDGTNLLAKVVMLCAACAALVKARPRRTQNARAACRRQCMVSWPDS